METRGRAGRDGQDRSLTRRTRTRKTSERRRKCRQTHNGDGETAERRSDDVGAMERSAETATQNDDDAVDQRRRGGHTNASGAFEGAQGEAT
jgi:hypothetical protein